MENALKQRNDTHKNRRQKQRNIRIDVFREIFVLTLLSLCTVSCNAVSIVSGFEKQTLQQGDNFTLECRATGLYHVTITWLLDGLPLEYTSPEPSGSIRLKADNPHSNFYAAEREEASRYLIKNSNELSTESNVGGDVIPIDVKDKESPKIGAINNDSASSAIDDKRTAPVRSRVLESNNKEPPPLVPANIALSGDGVVAITSVLSLSNATVSDGGIYTCVARDIIRETASWRRKIAVSGALSLRQNRPIFALIDSVVIIPCTVLGTGENQPVKWYHQTFPDTDEGPSAPENRWISLPDDHRQTVHTNGSFEIRDARKNNEGVYMCQVNLEGTLTNMSTPLKVMVPPKIKPFVLRPVQVGKTLAEFCVVSEGDFPLEISWYKNDKLLRPNEQIEMHRSGKRALSFAISSVGLNSAGNYSCCAWNNVSRTCTTSELVVLDPPKILGLLLQVPAISGNDVMIPCKATGFPKPNVTWMRVVDDSKREYLPVPRVTGGAKPDGSKFPRVSQSQNGSLVISNVSSAQGGKYLCRAQNKVDELSRFVTLQVHNPARVIELTGTQDVVYRNDVTIECTSWGDDVIDLKWIKDGRPITISGKYIGTTVLDYSFIESTHSVTMNRLKIKNTTRQDAGVYTCQASNKYGTSSMDIDILVRAPPSTPNKFEVIDKGTSFLRMIISPGEDDGGTKLLSYEVTYTKIPEEISETPPEHGRRVPTPVTNEKQLSTTVKFPASSESADQEIVLDMLECGSEYEMSIRGNNEIGTSFKALNLNGRTIGTVPIIPGGNEFVVDVNQSAVVLDLRAWQNGGCPFTELTIEYAKRGDTKWNITLVDSSILENALSPQTENGEKNSKNPGHIVIPDLQAGTWYKVWSSACNNAGCNYITHSVPTLLPDGSTVPPIKNEVEKAAADSDDARFLVPMVCGFGLVLLLALLFLFYRHKQRSKKDRRMKAARKMANKLLYKTDESSYSAPTAGGMRVELPDVGGNNDSDAACEVLVETSISCADEDEVSVGLQMTTDQGDDNVVTATYFEDPGQSHSDTLSSLPKESSSTSYAACGSHDSNNSSTNSRKSTGKKSLKDNAELAVFQGAASSDEEDHATVPLVCDESAFSDSGTWSYFQPGSRARRPKKYNAVPTIEKSNVPRRLSSSSSGTDEELAQVFGLASSKQGKFKPLLENEVVLKSDVNENYRPSSKGFSNNQNQRSKVVKQGPQINRKRRENYYLVRDQERANSTGMMQKTDPRHFKALPGDVHDNRRSNPVPPRTANNNTNPFKTAFRPPQQGPTNFHRPNAVHARGHTYCNGVPSNWNGHFPSAPQFGNPQNSSPYGERQWVDTYDSRYGTNGTNRSKPPSWGSTELDKQGFYTPTSSSVSATPRDHRREVSPKFHTPEIGSDHGDRTSYPSQSKDNRKLDTNSPRDSGIGSDEGPTSRHMTSSVSPPHMKGRNVQKSLESLDEVESHRGDRSSSCGIGIVPTKGDKNCVFPSPPPTPPVTDAKLTPHIFVDISSKCNTTPTRTSRSSYPPCRQVPASSYYHLGPPKKLDYLPTPPPSGPTSPEDPTFPRSRKRRGNNDGWCVADLDGLAKHPQKSDSRLTDGDISTPKIGKSRNSDTTYSMSKDERTWQASTLV